MRKSIMSVDYLQKQILELEAKIAEEIGDVRELKEKLNRLKVLEFEEDLRDTGNKQLLQE